VKRERLLDHPTRAKKSGPHGAHRHVEESRCLGVATLFDVDKHQDAMVRLGQPVDRSSHRISDVEALKQLA
jgi:hypothetical protein